MTVTETEIRKGLAGVYADTTAISMVNPQTNSLTYRGYPVQDLCRRCTFEEVAYLLWHGELPTRDQLAVQNQAERAQRALDPVIAATLAGLPLTAHPMDTLRTAVSLLGAPTQPRTTIPPQPTRPRPCGCSPCCPRSSRSTSGGATASAPSRPATTSASPRTSCT